MPSFFHRTELAHPTEEVFAWHARPGALRRLVPPWENVKVLESAALESGSTVTLEVRKGPAKVTWELLHTEVREGELFVDEQLRGPLARWRHEHRFLPDGADRTIVEDAVEWEPPLGSLGASFSSTIVERTLARAFAFRARRLAGDLARHARYGTGKGRTVAVTGATGFIGGALVAFLRTGGYRVIEVSRSSGTGDDHLQWDPAAGRLDATALEGVNAVVHLAGESIAGVRWTQSKKDAILRSREESTLLLARTLAALERPPEVLVSASGIGVYGDRGDRILTEESPAGEGFLAEVCRRWESATQPARAAGIRTVHLRNAMVLSPAGGVLGIILLPFRMGIGGRLGSGRQYTSWIDLDDEVGLILHALRTPELHGALNSCAPNPLPNAAFTDVLGRVLGRPTLLPVPALGVRAVLGQMGEELLLFGQRAIPGRAVETGYGFLYPELEDALRHQTGSLEASEPSSVGDRR